MKTIQKKEHTPANDVSRDLLKIELRIARRADQLVRTIRPALSQDLEYWRRAEREILAR
jgi:hypothetical protein